MDCTSPLIVCEASAGSGKTRVLIARVLRLIRDGADPSKIVCITYTTKAAHEMQERLGTVKLGYVGTLHSFCLGIVRQNAKLLNLPPQLSVVDDTLKEQVLAECVAENGYKGTQVAVAQVLELGLYQKQPLVVTKQCTVAKAYWTKMREGGLLDFDMILHCAIEALKRGATYECQHLLVDEIQDASHLDYQVYVALKCDKFFVGDGRQSIFGFRSGSVKWMRLLANDALSGAGLLCLNGCYRCGSSIIEASNALISHDDAVHVPAQSLTGTTGSVTVAEFKNDVDEIRAIAALINKNCTEPEQFNKVAVLLRYNALVTRFASGLRAHGIPVAERQEVQRPKDWALATALVSFVANPENDRLALTYIEACDGKWMALEAKAKAICAMSSVFSGFSDKSEAEYINLPQIMEDCSVSPESQSLILPLLDQCSTPNELLLRMNEQDSSVTQGEGVTVTTIHSYKGKENQTIILPAFEEGIMPGANEDEVHELRRLAYVAMTRAKERLVLTHCHERAKLYGYGNERMERSRFIQEAGL